MVFSFGNCKKNEFNGVMININNSTNSTLDSVQLVYDISHYSYGTILPGKTTEFKFFESMPDDPAASAYLGTKKILAGPIFPPNSYSYPKLANGTYTLLIFPDSTFPYGFNAKFIKN